MEDNPIIAVTIAGRRRRIHNERDYEKACDDAIAVWGQNYWMVPGAWSAEREDGSIDSFETFEDD